MVPDIYKHIFMNKYPINAHDITRFSKFPCASMGMHADVPNAIELTKTFNVVEKIKGYKLAVSLYCLEEVSILPGGPSVYLLTHEVG